MDLSEIIASLDGISLFVGAVIGLIAGVGFVLLTRYNMKTTFQQSLAAQQSSFDSALEHMKSSFGNLSSEALKSNQQEFLSLADRELDKKTEQHATELESKKELIDTKLQSMSKEMNETLKEVPVKLEQNQSKVSEVIEKSAKTLEESNKTHLTQMQQRSDTQTKEHIAKLDEKELLINRRLSEMDDKLGKVQKLIDEFEKARESKLGALDDQLKSLNATTNSLQKALADNQARGKWGERIAEQILRITWACVEGCQLRDASDTRGRSGERPDFTFLCCPMTSR